MERRNNALVIGYRGHRIVEHVKSLEKLREKGLVGKIDVLASRITPDVPVDLIEYPEKINPNFEIQRMNPESGTDNSKKFQDYVSDIRKTAYEMDSDLIIPTTDRAVIATAHAIGYDEYVKGIITSSPFRHVVNLFQDKNLTYRFFDKYNIFKTPLHRVVDAEEVNWLKGDLLETSKPYFAKPVCPQKGGGTGAEKVSSVKELHNLMKANPQYPYYLVSEFLQGPEINHTAIINQDGTVAAQRTYEVSSEGHRQRINISNDEINKFGHRFGKTLHRRIRMLEFRSVYNFDFLRNDSGELVLSEVNPGRFPAHMDVYNRGDFNALEPLLAAITKN